MKYAKDFDLKHGSLFSGIGGFDLAAQWAGFDNIFQVEINEYCQKVLTKNFPKVKRYKDIKEFDGTEYKGTVDIISGGFPCQPFSIAGKQKGAGDDRNLWPEMFRIIQEIRPTWVLGENVANIINFVEFDNILADLEAAEYEVQPLIIPAVAKDAKHRRDRVWIVAYTELHSNRRQKQRSVGKKKEIQGINRKKYNTTGKFSRTSSNANTKSQGLERPKSKGEACTDGLPSELRKVVADTEKVGWQQSGNTRKRRAGFKNNSSNVANAGCKYEQRDAKRMETNKAKRATSKLSIESSSQGCSRNWPTEPGVGRVANGIPNRVDRLKGLGNAIVPQVAFTLFEAIKATKDGCAENRIET